MFRLSNTDNQENDFSDFNLSITIYGGSIEIQGAYHVHLYAPSDNTHPSCVEVDIPQGDYTGDVTVTYTINSSLTDDVIRTEMPVVQLVQDGTCSP